MGSWLMLLLNKKQLFELGVFVALGHLVGISAVDERVIFKNK